MVLTAKDQPKDGIETKSVQEIPCINELGDADEAKVLTHTSKGRTVRNVLILAFAYFLFFTGFWSLSNLQSTMNGQGGMGVDSQAVIYLCSMLSCFFPELLLGKLGTKTTYVLCLLLSCPYIASNFSLNWGTMMSSSALYGLMSGPLNSALSIYIDEMSVRFKVSSSESRENISAYFFGLNMFFAEFTQVVGNAVSYYVLLNGHPDPPKNFSVRDHCGIHFDPKVDGVNNTNLVPPSDRDRYMVSGIFLVMGLGAVVTALFLDPLKNDIREVKGCQTVSKRIVSAVKHLKNPHQLLLLPISVYLGIEGSFYSAEFTRVSRVC